MTYATVVGSCHCCVGWAKRKAGLELEGMAVKAISDWGPVYIIQIPNRPDIDTPHIDDREHGYMYMCKSGLKLNYLADCLMKGDKDAQTNRKNQG